MIRLFRALALWLGLVATPIVALAQTAAPPFTPQQRQQIETIVREYLLANPELLRELFTALETRENAAQARAQADIIARHREQLVGNARHAVLGNPRGDVTIVEFFDYNCGFCKRAAGDMRELLRTDPNVRLVLKEFPVLGPASVEAAQISAQLHAHPRFGDFHARLLATEGQANRASAIAVARELGIDTRRIEAEMRAQDTMARIEEVYGLANALSIGGTPTYVIGDEVVVGAVGLAELRRRVVAMRQCGRTSC
jgi:protein-disulfide isomerase